MEKSAWERETPPTGGPGRKNQPATSTKSQRVNKRGYGQKGKKEGREKPEACQDYTIFVRFRLGNVIPLG